VEVEMVVAIVRFLRGHINARFSFALLLLVTLATGLGHGQEKTPTHNGFWWVGSSETFKLGFVTGYVMAMVHVEDIEGFLCLAERNGGTIPEKYPGDEALKACTTQNARIAAYNFDQLRLGQLSEGVDEFYKDFLNKGIDINPAMTYVRDELKGKPEKDLEEELAKLRNAAN
jgi:hypothetical protein